MRLLHRVFTAHTLVPLSASVVFSSALVSELVGQNGNIDEEAATLVVKLEARFRGEEPEDTVTDFGSGIVVAMDQDSVWIATARHAVCRALDCAEVWIVSTTPPRRLIEAHLGDEQPDGVDLAFMTVPRSEFVGLRGEPPDFDRRGRVTALRVGDPVYPVGCPLGECDKTSSPPDRVVSNDGKNISFLSLLVAKGSSGGAIFDRDWEVVGMVFYDQQPFGIALSIDTVLAALDSIGHAASLARPFLPRSGYRTTFGVNMVVPIDSDSVVREARDKVAGRISFIHRPISALSWHVAGVRTTAGDLTMNGLMAGAGLYPTKPGRFGVRIFAEVGFCSTVARYDTGGYFTAGFDRRYVPVWERAEQTDLGGGGGVSFELLFLPHTILEVVAGYWSFSVPDMPGLDETYIPAPNVSHIQFGAGLRFGM